MKTILETKRLIIRETTLADFDNLKQVIGDPINMKYYPKPYNDEDVRRWLNWCISSYQKNGFGLYAIELKDTHQYIGDCGFSLQNIDGETLIELGYHLNKKYQHQGYIYEASQALLDYGFNTLNFPCVFSYMTAENVPSHCVAIRNKMNFLKIYEENGVKHCVYAINKEDFNQKKNPPQTKMQKIIVLGSPGSGKSYLSKELSKTLNLPLYHLDILYWQEGWVGKPRDEFINIQKDIMHSPKWIIDGSYVSTLEFRIKEADTVILLETPTEECIKNEAGRRGKPRSDLPSYLKEEYDPEFIEYIKGYPEKEMRLIKAYIFNHHHIIYLKNKNDIETFFNSLKAQTKS